LESWDNLYEAMDLLEGSAHAPSGSEGAGQEEEAPSAGAGEKKEFGKKLKWANFGNMEM
jgi:hypothetical protein